MVDHFLNATPETLTSFETAIVVLAGITLLGLCLWVQSAGVRALDRFMDRYSWWH